MRINDTAAPSRPIYLLEYTVLCAEFKIRENHALVFMQHNSFTDMFAFLNFFIGS